MKANVLRTLALGAFLATLMLAVVGCSMSPQHVTIDNRSIDHKNIDDALERAQEDLADAAFDKARAEVARAKKTYYRLTDLEKVDARAEEGIRTREMIIFYMGLGKEAFDAADYDYAIYAFQVVLDLDPDHEKAALYLQMARNAPETPQPPDPPGPLAAPEPPEERPITVTIKGLGTDKMGVVLDHLRRSPGILEVRQADATVGRATLEVDSELSVRELARALEMIPAVPLEAIKHDDETRVIMTKGAASAFAE